MRLGGSVLLGALIAVATLAAPATTSAGERASSVDNELEMKAREAFAAGRYDEALDTFAKMYAKSLNPVYLRNIGRCFQKKREPEKAIDEFQDYLAKTKSGKYRISADERAEIQGYIKEMEALRDEQARAATATPPPPPVQPIQAAPPANPTAALPPDLSAPAAAADLTATAPPPEEHHSVFTRWWFWTIVGAVVVGGAVTAVALSGGTTKPACLPMGAICE
jgi:hypothetical protein